MARKLRLVPDVSKPNQRVLQNVGRKTDAEYGRAGRKYLTPVEVDALIRAAKDGRHGRRDATMIAVAYHYALRCSELIALTALGSHYQNSLAIFHPAHCLDAVEDQVKCYLL